MPTWDPDRYLSFDDQRTRPARELLARVPPVEVTSVVDVGCGPGNSTRLLLDRWPQARVIGLDSSTEMLEQARQVVPEAELVAADLTRWRPPEPVDVVFSNATLQWVESHPVVLEHLLTWLAPGGVLAVQMPDNYDALSHVLMREVAARARWRSRLEGVLRASPVAVAEDYYRLLQVQGAVDLWTTEYLHVLDGPDPVLRWVSGTGLRPVLDRLGDEEGAEFAEEYATELRSAYPRGGDGTTLFPFRRLFFVVST